MKRNIIKLFYLALCMVSSIYAMAYDAEIDGFFYNFISEDEAEVTYKDKNYGSYSGIIVIPESITNEGKTYSVTKIGQKAFYSCLITSVTIPNSVTNICENAFYNCRNLTTVTIPSSVTSIGEKAFQNCSSLTSIAIPSSVATIQTETFSGCFGLTTITIPNSVTSIEPGAFSNCYGLTSITIPEGVTKIFSHVFWGCINLETVYLPASITYIGSMAFSYDNQDSYFNRGYQCLPYLKDIYCPASTLPKLEKINRYYDNISGQRIDYEAYLFGKVQPNRVTLHVPSNTISDYSASMVWNSCKSIVPMDHALKYLVDGETYECDTLFYMSEIIPATPPTKEGYTFSGWNGLPEIMPDEDVTVTGAFSVNQYTLTYVVDGETYQSLSFDYGTALTAIEAPTKEGYTFSGWSEIPETMPDHNVTVTGTFTINQYTITFDTEGGTPIEDITQDYKSAITPPADPTREGYTFIGWEPAIPETMPLDGLTVKALWQVNSYTLTYLVDGEEYKTYSVNYGTTITPEEEPTKEGYTFSGWSEIPETMPAHDVTITGTFTTNLSSITFDTNGGSPIETITQVVGSAITPPADPTKEGYTFMGWEPAIPETMPAGGLTCVAQWQINSYAIIYIVDGVEYSRSEVEYGAEITPLEAPTKEGYTFSGWSYIPATMPATEVRIFGTFSINNYTITYMVDGEVYKTSTVAFGSEVIPEEEPTKEGYTFSGWSEIPETMPAGDVVVTGTFTANSYTLLYIVDGEEYKSESIPYGTTITPEEEPSKEGYTFSGWSEIPETMPAEDVTVTGSFTINSYTLLYVIDGEDYKSYEVDYNTPLTPEPAPVKKGMTFSGWGDVPETMPAHDVTLSGTYTWSKETYGGIVYEVADTLNNYVTVIGYEGTEGEAELLSEVEIGGDFYTVHSIAEDALPKTVTIHVTVGRLLLWLWTNGYEDIKETETGRDLTAPEVALAKRTASSLTLSFVNDYPELTETLKVSGTAVEKGEKGYETTLRGLEPDNLYDGLAVVTLTFEDASYTKSYSFRTEPLTLTALQPKVVSLGNVIVVAETNLNDEEVNVGFEWRRIDWTEEFESRTGAAYLYEGIMEGYIRSLNAERLWKFRPYYTSNAGNTYYGEWKGMDPSDYSYFEPTVHTYEPLAVTDQSAEVKGYAMRGTEDVTSQGFMCWKKASPQPSPIARGKRASAISDDVIVVEVQGHVMKTTLEGLDYDTEYCVVAFVKTADGEMFYGEQQSFRTTFDPDGIKDPKDLKDFRDIKDFKDGLYDLSGRKLDKPTKGINIIRMNDGTTKKVLIK